MCNLVDWFKRIFTTQPQEKPMSFERKESFTLRLRGFKPADAGAENVLKAGNGPAPKNPDGTPMQCLWDQDQEHHTVVRPHAVVAGEDDEAPASTS